MDEQELTDILDEMDNEPADMDAYLRAKWNTPKNECESCKVRPQG